MPILSILVQMQFRGLARNNIRFLNPLQIKGWISNHWFNHHIITLAMKTTLSTLSTVNHLHRKIGANYQCANLVFHTRMKHLSIAYHFVRDLFAKKELQVSHVPFSHQLVDFWKTKSWRIFFWRLKQKIEIFIGTENNYFLIYHNHI